MDKTVRVTCKICNKTHEVKCKKKDYSSWRDGDGFIQDLMPYLSADDRELLISGNCGECFDKMFPSGVISSDEDDVVSDVISSDEDDEDEESEEFEYDDYEPALDLTSREQEVMAEICSLLSGFIMDEDDNYARLGEKIFLATDGCSSQFFGRLYDKFHRTGKNQ